MDISKLKDSCYYRNQIDAIESSIMQKYNSGPSIMKEEQEYLYAKLSHLSALEYAAKVNERNIEIRQKENELRILKIKPV